MKSHTEKVWMLFLPQQITLAIHHMLEPPSLDLTALNQRVK